MIRSYTPIQGGRFAWMELGWCDSAIYRWELDLQDSPTANDIAQKLEFYKRDDSLAVPCKVKVLNQSEIEVEYKNGTRGLLVRCSTFDE